jgi:hypothetical protein
VRPILTFILALLILTAGVVPLFGAHPVLAKDRQACCEAPRQTGGCGPRPMPCCEVRPAPAPTAALPPSGARAEAPTQTHLQMPSQTLFPAVFQAVGLSSVPPHPLSVSSDPPRLYLLHSAYLI